MPTEIQWVNFGVLNRISLRIFWRGSSALLGRKLGQVQRQNIFLVAPGMFNLRKLCDGSAENPIDNAAVFSCKILLAAPDEQEAAARSRIRKEGNDGRRYRWDSLNRHL